MPFVRGGHKKPKLDNTGNVIIKIFLAEKGHYPVKGNRMMTLSVKDAKVSAVFDAIEKALFPTTVE